MEMAFVAARRGTCDRKRVGAVIVKDNHSLATGYNGAPSGWPSCDDVGHQMLAIGFQEVACDGEIAHDTFRRERWCRKCGVVLPATQTDNAHKVKVPGRESCIRTIHAEENAILQAAKYGTSIQGATLYTTASTCYDCLKRVAQVGIVRIVHHDIYLSARSSDIDINKLCKTYNIELVHAE